MKNAMTTLPIRSLLALSLAVLLTACGGADVQTAPIQTAAVMQTSFAPAQVVASAAQAAPQPDCAPEGCKGLRIIDGNAEAYRLEAQRRAADPANG